MLLETKVEGQSMFPRRIERTVVEVKLEAS